MRIQPGPSEHYGRTHRDAEYGHQPGEINFWLQLTAHEVRRAAFSERPP